MFPSIDEAKRWYAPDDPVHGFDHALRVLRTAMKLGGEMGADLEVLHAAALLHDAVGADPSDTSGKGKRSSHEEDSAEFARRLLQDEGWEDDRIEQVIACIRSHRYRGGSPPESLEAKILFDADKLDVNGAFGAARTLGYAIQAGQPYYARPSQRFLETGEKEPDEPHSAYHEYLFKLRRVRERLHTPAARRMSERRHQVLCIFFEQLASEAEGVEVDHGKVERTVDE